MKSRFHETQEMEKVWEKFLLYHPLYYFAYVSCLDVSRFPSNLHSSNFYDMEISKKNETFF